MITELYFLGAGKPASGDRPSAIKNILTNTRALDWQLNSFSDVVQEKDIYFLGGYHIDEIVELYPNLNFTINPDWQSKNALNTLLSAPLSGDSAFITYSDTLFTKDFINKLTINSSEVIVVVDSLWKKRFKDRTREDITNAETIMHLNQEVEFTGLIYLNKQSMDLLREAQKNGSIDSIGSCFQQFFNFLESRDVKVNYIDVFGNWAEFNSTQDITNLILGTKADTLSRLENIVEKSHIGKQINFTVLEWESNQVDVVNKIQKQFSKTKLVIRSSSAAEDNWNSSNAGGFESILDVPSSNKEELISAIDTVKNSYGIMGSKSDQILVQEFLQDVSMAGVVFTCSIENGAPYYRFNFDDSSKSTESVTAGNKADLRTVILSKDNSESIDKIFPELNNVLAAVQEIEALLNFDKLDIEFAVDSNSKVHIFQVRPIVVNHDSYEIEPLEINSSLKNDINRFKQLQKKLPQISGDRTLLANMPDWNPAEIIGVKPKPLAFSLYQYLITNDIWAKQRAEYGYRDVRPMPLIHSFSGQPYVDVRASFNSFLPEELPDDSYNRIVEAYIKILDENKQFHDKVEFEVAFTVWAPDFKKLAKSRLSHYGVLDKDIELLENALKEITRNALIRLDKDTESVAQLTERRLKIHESDLSPLDKAYSLLNDCLNFGTLAFSHAARAGFVAKILLESLTTIGALSKERIVEFMNSFDTVAGCFEAEKIMFLEGKITKDDLVEKYGHLRPGTYEITTPAYWEDPETYLIPNNNSIQKPHKKEFKFDAKELKGISKILLELNSDLSEFDFIHFVKKATQERESVKFEFTKNLSNALDYINEFAGENGISRKDSSFLSYSDLEALKLNMMNINSLRKNILLRKKAYKITKVIELPSVISSIDNFYCFERHSMLPNYIGVSSVIADVKKISDEQTDLTGKIIIISQADPGYDWLFSHNIAGLITQYGGANSHMAIRSAEIGLPAAIGVGEKLYEELSQANRLELDCLGQRIRLIE